MKAKVDDVDVMIGSQVWIEENNILLRNIADTAEKVPPLFIFQHSNINFTL